MIYERRKHYRTIYSPDVVSKSEFDALNCCLTAINSIRLSSNLLNNTIILYYTGGIPTMKVSIVRFLINKIKSGLGIVQDTDTATQAISQGKYVWWKGSLKKASSNIAATDTLSSSNLSDVSEGVLNELSGQIGSLNTIVYVGSIVSEGSSNCNYPTGFSANNCYVSGAFYGGTNNERIYTGKIDVIMYDNTMSVWNHIGSNKTIYLVLQRLS